MRKLAVWFMLFCGLGLAAPLAVSAADNPPQKVAAASVIDINSASAAELQTISGIGPVTADRIVAYRNEHGKFATVDELEKVKGIGEKTLAKIRKFVDAK